MRSAAVSGWGEGPLQCTRRNVGLAPVNRDSGTFRGQRHIFGGRADVRRILYVAALVASRFNPAIQACYRRLLAAEMSPAELAQCLPP